VARRAYKRWNGAPAREARTQDNPREARRTRDRPGQRSRGGRGRVEVDGANAARDFLREHGVSGDALRVVWDAIALH
jgi:hypothetical protein